MPGRILDEACARAAASAAALIEHDDAVMPRVEELPGALIGAGAGATVQEHCRFARRVAALFVIDFVDVRYAQVTVPKGLERRIELAPRGVGLADARGIACLDGTCREFCSTDRFLFGRRALGGGPTRRGGGSGRRARLI